MVKTSKISPFPFHINHRFALKHNDFKARESGCVSSLKSHPQAVLMNIISLLQDEWATEYRTESAEFYGAESNEKLGATFNSTFDR